MKNIAIIGGGNLGAAIAEGLIKSNFTKPKNITITRRNTEPLAYLCKQGVKVTSDNEEAIRESEVVIVAVKPYNVREILNGLKHCFNPRKHILVSVIRSEERRVGKK